MGPLLLLPHTHTPALDSIPHLFWGIQKPKWHVQFLSPTGHTGLQFSCPLPGPPPARSNISLPWERRVGCVTARPSMAHGLPQGCNVRVPRTFSMKQCLGATLGPCSTTSPAAEPSTVLPARRHGPLARCHLSCLAGTQWESQVPFPSFLPQGRPSQGGKVALRSPEVALPLWVFGPGLPVGLTPHPGTLEGPQDAGCPVP